MPLQTTARGVESAGPGNVLQIEVESDGTRELFTGFGQKGKAAERVASELCREVQEYLGSPAPVGRHLADQLLLPMALGQGGSFLTLEPTLHTRTNIEVIGRFLENGVTVQQVTGNCWKITVGPG